MKIISSVSPDQQTPRIRQLLSRWRSKIEAVDLPDAVIEAGPDHVQLRCSSRPGDKPLSVDFLAGKIRYRCKFGGGRSQMIAKAVGVRRGVCPSIVDATAGLGRDAFVLASLGCRVHMLERSPVVALLLADGLERAAEDKEIGPWIAERLSLDCGDSLKGLETLPFKPDVVYLDPMYGKKKKSALVKKEMRVLKSVVGEDLDSGALLGAALRTAQNRVVVKRSAGADWLNNQKPDMSLKTLKNRFDLYLIQGKGKQNNEK